MSKRTRKPKTEHVDLGEHGSFNIHKGGLHRATGTPMGQKIPEAKIESAAHSSNPHVRRMAASAKGLKAMHHGRTRRPR